MRHLVWFTIGFAGACAVGVYLLRGTGMLVLLAVCAGLMLLTGLMASRRRLLVPVTLLLAGLCVGSAVFFRFDARYLQPVSQVDGQMALLSFTASADSRETAYGFSVDGTILLNGRSYATRLYFQDEVPVSAGDTLNVTARLRSADLSAGQDLESYAWNTVLIHASPKGEMMVIAAGKGLQMLPGMVRQALKAQIDANFPEDTRGFAAALLLGDKTGLSDEVRFSFQLAGLSHIVAVSGLHMSILFALVCLITGRHRFWTPVLGIPAVLLFAAVAGFTPSVTRAAIMEILFLTALAADREYDPPTALAFAVLTMLLGNPMTIASCGFQLSVASVSGIFLFYGKIMGWFREKFDLKGKGIRKAAARGLCAGISVSLSATVLTTPLSAYYFGTVSLVGLIANVLVVPVISLIFYGILLTCLVGAVSAGIGTSLGWAVSLLVRYVFGVSGVLAGLPLAAVYTESVYIVFWLVFCYVLFAWAWLRSSGHIRGVACAMTLGLALSLCLSWCEPWMDPYRVTVLDVGQGQCVLLQSRGNVFVVDCGGDSDTAAGDKAGQTLLSMGISRIDGLILTHYDRDHVGGSARLALWVDIDRLYLPRTEENLEVLRKLLNAAPDAERNWLDADAKIAFGDCEIRIFAPENKKSGNESCAAVLFQSEKYDTLITGDANASDERRLLETGLLPDLELLIVGHHGSKTSTCAELLHLTRPEIAMISVGGDNSYGHPAVEVLRRLTSYGCEIYRTDQMGDIVFRG